MESLLRIFLVLNLLQPTGCAQGPYRVDALHGKDSALQSWVATELAPYLAQELGQHPRFKGEPVALVKLEGPDVQPDIDNLTRNIRDQVRDTLLATPGVRLPWQPQQYEEQHHRRLADVDCGRIRDADYYIGFEITRTPNKHYRASVRALDVRAGEWVSGFGKSWEGYLTSREQHALEEQRLDESLRGLRVLPFSSNQPDLAAAYLANNVSCLLRQHDEDDLVLYAESFKSDQPALRTLLDLIGNNLSRYREVRVTDKQSEAQFILRGEAHKIQSGLYQVWIVLNPIRSGEHLAGMDTATYVRIKPPDAMPRRTTLVRKNPQGKPVISGFELINLNNEAATRGLCAEESSSRDCRILEMRVDKDDEVFVIAHSAEDGLVRLSPSSCYRDVQSAVDGYVRRTWSLPDARFSALQQRTVYGLAVSSTELGERFRQLLQVVPDGCSRATQVRMDGERLDRWLSRLDQLVARNADKVAWTAKRLP